MKRFAENNEKWLKTTIAEYKNGTSGSEGGPEISYEDVDTSLISPRPRKYN
jgi:domain.